MEEKRHAHIYKVSTCTEDSCGQNEGHVHKHGRQNLNVILNRLCRASGHLNAVKRMVQEGEDCIELLVQLSAVIAALTNTGKLILKNHIEHCIVDAVNSGDEKAIEDLNNAIDRFMK